MSPSMLRRLSSENFNKISVKLTFFRVYQRIPESQGPLVI